MASFVCRVGQNHTYIRIYSVFIWYFKQRNHHTYIRSYTVCIYGSGQPYLYGLKDHNAVEPSVCARIGKLWRLGQL